MIVQAIFSIAFFTMALAALIWFVIDEIRWKRHKEEIKRIYVEGGVEQVRGYWHFFQTICFVLCLFVGLLIFPWWR